MEPTDNPEARALPKIFSTTNKGFTLLEIILVIAIIATVVAFAIPRINTGQSELKSAVRRIGVASREAKRMAKLYNSTYRMVIEMPSTEVLKESEETPKFWVESAPGSILVGEALENPPEENDDDKDNVKQFALASKITKEPYELPEGLFFKSVEFSATDNAVEEGRAYIYYLPEGLVTEAAIHIHFEESLKWTLAIHPLTGKVDIFDKDISLDEIRDQ